MSVDRYEGDVVRLALVAGDEGVIRNTVFERCDVKGPALLVPTGCTFEHNRFDGDADALLWEVPPERGIVVGAILVENCTFTGCHFMAIGIAGPPEVIALFRNELGNGTP